MDSGRTIPCPDPDCVDGTIIVYDAYSDTPLVGEAQICDCCNGNGSIVVPSGDTFN